MFDYRRTHTGGVLNKGHIGTQVTLSGWVHRRRDHGGLIFIDLRDRYGLTQLVLSPKAHDTASSLRAEWVISVKGKVIARTDGMANPKLATGEIEIEVKELAILSKALTPPFSVCDENIDVNEELRLKYRYLDMRRGDIQKKLIMRHQVCMAVREYMDKQKFIEVTTPILAKSTPEGARDYLVPSRTYPGTFFALPQSPQIFKQLLMIGGMDRYFQIATCFRDEDLRANRQPEFAQIDVEMSFEVPETLFGVIEGLLASVFKKAIDITIPHEFTRIPHAECLERFGTDKPDCRFGMELIRLDDIVKDSTFSVFLEQLNSGGCVKAICVKGGADVPRSKIDAYTAFVSAFGLKGLAWMKLQEEGLTSNIVKFFSPEVQKELIACTKMEKGDLLLIAAEQPDRVNQSLDHLRRRVAGERGLIDPNKYSFLWVIDFPLFSWNSDSQELESEHHPFTSPLLEDIHLMDTEPLKVRSSSYDIVLNGYELASGSQRIHNGELQEKIFKTLKLSDEDITSRFGFFIESLQYGTPPHLGVALGLDRLVMILTQTDNIRDVIAFPKTQKASDLMMDAPSTVEIKQLKDLKIFVEK